MPSKSSVPSVAGALERPATEAPDPATGLVRGVTVRDWVDRAVDALRTGRDDLDRANVFPVPDSDTGTNLYLTLREGAAALGEGAGDVGGREVGVSAGRLLTLLARGALLGARGNSGIILSEYLRGWASAVADAPAWGAVEVVRGLDAGARTASLAVARPAPGTILTAARAAADEAAGAGAAGRPVVDVVAAACAGARAATARSVVDLDVLARAGVLDAGAQGLVLVLDALHRALVTAPGEGLVPAPVAAAEPVSVAHGTMAPMPPETTHDGEFEVMFALTADERGSDAVAGRLRARLQEIGESVVVVGGPAPGDTGLWQAHVHTDDPVAAIEAGRAVVVGEARFVRGMLRDVRVRHLRVCHDVEPTAEAGGPGVVAVTSAPGLVPDLARSGAVVLLAPDDPAAGIEPPDARTIRRGCVDTRARTVVVLSGADGDRVRAELSGHGVAAVELLPAVADVQVVAALAAAQTVGDDTSADERVAVMRRTVEGVRVRCIGPGQEPQDVLDDLLAGPDRIEALTVLTDRAVPADVVETVVYGAARRAPDLETIVLASGRSGAGVELGAEAVR